MLSNCIQLYHAVRKAFPGDKAQFYLFVDPLHNHSVTNWENIQFVYDNGNVAGIWRPRATEFVVVNPLAGPFYDLPLVGLTCWKDFWVTEKDGVEVREDFGWGVNAVVKLDGKLRISAAILIDAENEEVIKKELGPLVDNNWYTIERINNDGADTLRYFKDGNLVQEGGV